MWVKGLGIRGLTKGDARNLDYSSHGVVLARTILRIPRIDAFPYARQLDTQHPTGIEITTLLLTLKIHWKRLLSKT